MAYPQGFKSFINLI